jgi:hypothetical protein
MTTATATYELTIVDGVHPGRPPLTMNDAHRVGWHKKRDARIRIHYQIKKALQDAPVPPLERATVAITQYAPDARRRDADSLGLFRKHALDALVKEGVLLDDAQKYVVDGGNHIDLDRGNPRMVITLQTF